MPLIQFVLKQLIPLNNTLSRLSEGIRPAFDSSGELTGLTNEVAQQAEYLNKVCEPQGVGEAVHIVSDTFNNDAIGFRGLVNAWKGLKEQPVETLQEFACLSAGVAGAGIAVDLMLTFAENHFNQPNPSRDSESRWEKIKKTARETGLYARSFSELTPLQRAARGAIDIVIGSALIGLYRTMEIKKMGGF